MPCNFLQNKQFFSHTCYDCVAVVNSVSPIVNDKLYKQKFTIARDDSIEMRFETKRR
jgi:hypothetical protein